MDDKILHQVCGVLDKYDKDYTEDGALANLKSWQNNKGWLVELLHHHPNWNEDALAVVFEVTHSREIDRSTVNYYRYDIIQLVDAFNISEDDRNKFCWALDMVASAYAKTLPDMDIAIKVKEYCGVNCSAGQKTSRIINAICKKYGLDEHPEYNAKFARLADSLNPMQVKRTALLSVHPCDYLEMSNRDNSWSSCHCLEGGEYHGGILSYMNDECSMIFYTVDDGVTESFHTFPKRTRQVFCFNSGILLQSRLYPQTDDNDTREMYRNIVQQTIADCLSVPNLWVLKREHEEVSRRVSTHDYALHYRDYEYKSYKPNISLLKEASVGEDDCMLIGHTAYCLDCSEPVAETNTIYCDYCSDGEYITCYDCGHRVHEDNAQYIDGRYYCEDCCSYCDHCHVYTTSTTEVCEHSEYPSYVCSSCLEEHYYYCENCGEYFLEDGGHETNDGFCCNKCLEEEYCVCDSCSEYVHINGVEEVDGGNYCTCCARDVEDYEASIACPVSA